MKYPFTKKQRNKLYKIGLKNIEQAVQDGFGICHSIIENSKINTRGKFWTKLFPEIALFTELNHAGENYITHLFQNSFEKMNEQDRELYLYPRIFALCFAIEMTK